MATSLDRIIVHTLWKVQAQLVSAGCHLAGEAGTSEVAQLYFFVNRAEADKWMLRTCELRALVSATSASPHLALHSCYAWLAQLLAALRPFAAAATSNRSNPSNPLHSNLNRGATNTVTGANSTVYPTVHGAHASGSTGIAGDTGESFSGAKQSHGKEPTVPSNEESSAPTKQIRILKPQGPPEASKPRSVVKVQYSRDRTSLEQARSSGGGESGHAGTTPPTNAVDAARAAMHHAHDKQRSSSLTTGAATGSQLFACFITDICLNRV